MSFKEPSVCFKNTIEGYSGISSDMGLSGKEDELLPRQKPFEFAGCSSQFTFTNLIEGF